MTRMTRAEAFAVLEDAGYPWGEFRTNLGITVPFDVLVVAIGGAESDLTIEAQGPPNKDGSIDRGWKQINSIHGYDEELLLSDPLYTAKAALQILLQQGIRAWAAYGVKNVTGQFPYARRMPPGLGGPDIAVKGSAAREIVVSLQTFLNTVPSTSAKLVLDGAYGPKSAAALTAWSGESVCTGAIWKRTGLR